MLTLLSAPRLIGKHGYYMATYLVKGNSVGETKVTYFLFAMCKWVSTYLPKNVTHFGVVFFASGSAVRPPQLRKKHNIATVTSESQQQSTKSISNINAARGRNLHALDRNKHCPLHCTVIYNNTLIISLCVICTSYICKMTEHDECAPKQMLNLLQNS